MKREPMSIEAALLALQNIQSTYTPSASEAKKLKNKWLKLTRLDDVSLWINADHIEWIEPANEQLHGMWKAKSIIHFVSGAKIYIKEEVEKAGPLGP